MNELFLKIINMSISASWLILAVLILRLVLKKAPKWVNVLLWGIVAVRLICPLSFESALSLIPSSETIPLDIEMAAKPTIDSGVPAINSVVNPVLSSFAPPQHVLTSANPLQIWIPILNIIWLIGVGALLLYTAVSYWRLCRKVDTAVRYKGNIFQSENVSSPFVLGIIKPRIYLPFNMNGQDLEHVVAHEQAHIRRKDHWWKPLGFLLLTIHWFNPLMWLAYVLLCRDIELACDEKVIKELGNEQRADYMQALVACSVNRRMIAACPLAFGEVGVKERVKSVMNYKKPAFWVIIIAVIICVGVAACFLTNPKQDRYTLRIVVPAGSQEEFVYTEEEVSTVRNSIKIWSGDGLGDTEVLLFPVNKTAETGYTATYLTHGMSVEFDAENDTWFKIGVNMQNPTNEDIIVYVEVENVEVRIVDEINSVIEWFDYLETPDEMKWDGSLEISLTEFPDVTFRWTYGEIVAVKGNKTTSLYTGMPIWNTYFCDLTGDGLPEFCSTISWGSGIIDNRVMIYDYANGVSYSLEERGVSDYTLRQNESDGQLYVDKTAHVGGGLLSTGRLVFEDDCLQVLWPEKPNDNISEITDPTDDPNFAYDTAVEKIYEDERNEYFISGLYSQYIIVHYTDGTQEDIGTALNAGRATFADLDKFGIRYWAEPKPNSFDIAENTVAEIGRGTLKTAVALCEEDAGKLLSLVESGTWVETTEMPDQYNDCAINLGGRLLYYSSKNGTLIQYDLSKVTTYSHPAPSGGRYWTLGMAERLFVNNILCEYIDLAYEITDVAAPDDDEELCRFYLTIGAEGVKSIELSMPSSSGGCENADGSYFHYNPGSIKCTAEVSQYFLDTTFITVEI